MSCEEYGVGMIRGLYFKGCDYTKLLKTFKKEVDKKLGDNNAKFTGFLMMGMEEMKDEE